MIEMHIGKQNRSATPKTTAALTIVLPHSLFDCESTFSGAAAIVSNTLLSTVSLWIFGVIFAAFMWIVFVKLALLSRHLDFMGPMIYTTSFSRNLQVVLSIAFEFGSFFIGIVLSPAFLVGVGADLTPRRKAIGIIATTREIICCSWLCFAAFCAALLELKQGKLNIHSASLSLYHKLMSAGGVNCHFSRSYALADLSSLA